MEQTSLLLVPEQPRWQRLLLVTATTDKEERRTSPTAETGQRVLLCSAERTSTGYSRGETRATSEEHRNTGTWKAEKCDLVCLRWRSGAQVEPAEYHLIDTQRCGAVWRLQAVIKREDVDLCLRSKTRAWRRQGQYHVLVPESHPVILCVIWGHVHIPEVVGMPRPD